MNEGIIFKVIPFKENNRLIYVLTKEGKMVLNVSGARTIKGKYRTLAQVLTQIRFENKFNVGISNLKNGEIINDFEAIKKNYQNFKFALIIIEIINKIEGNLDNNEKIYNLLLSTLHFDDIKSSALSFAAKMTYFLGFGMNLKGNGKKIRGFNINQAQLIYEDQSDNIDLNFKETYALLKLTYTKINDLEKIDKNMIDVLRKFIYDYYLKKINLKISSLKMKG